MLYKRQQGNANGGRALCEEWKLQDVHFGIRIEKREEFISAVVPTQQLTQLLECQADSPILRIEIKLTSFIGDVVEYRISHCNLGNLKFMCPHNRQLFFRKARSNRIFSKLL